MSEVVESYLTLSKENITVARKLLYEHPRHAAFCVQQAAETLVRAVIEAEQRGPVQRGHEHQIAMLTDYLGSDHNFYYDFQKLDQTSPFATRMRYPSAGGKIASAPRHKDIEGMIEEIEIIYDDVRDHCYDVLSSSGPP